MGVEKSIQACVRWRGNERLDEMSRRRPEYWNIWWTLALVSAAITVGVLVLDALGLIGQVGLGR
jgi:hypothetical protein